MSNRFETVLFLSLYILGFTAMALGCRPKVESGSLPTASGASIAATPAVAPPEQLGRLEEAKALADIALARQGLESLHAGYDRYVGFAELSAQWDALEARAKGGMDAGTLYLELSRILAGIRCDHTKAELPKAWADKRETDSRYLPFRFIVFGERMFVEGAIPATELARGQEIISIDTMSVKEWIRALSPLIPVDGDAEHVKAKVLANSSEFMGPALDHFAPFLIRIGDTADLVVEDLSGRRFSKRVQRVSYSESRSILGEGEQYSANFAEGVRFQRLGNNGAYLAVDTFINYRNTVDAMAKLAAIFKTIQEEKRTKLIVDIRNNGGGSNDAEVALLAHLIQKPTLRVSDIWTRFSSIPQELRPHLETWEKAALDPEPSWFEPVANGMFKLLVPGMGATGVPVRPAKYAFAGELAILIGPNNSSASTHLVSVLKVANRGTLVGERTGGAPSGATAGILYFLTLPHSKIRIRIPALRTIIANGASLPKRNGIAPQVLAPMTLNDFLSNTDPALDSAKSMLGL